MMSPIKAVLQRNIKTTAGTFGILRYDTYSWFTVERPWLDNKSNVSCIPTGEYTCEWTLSPRLKKWTYEIMRVPNRTGIRIHSANFPTQVIGCVALGEKLGTIDGKQAVLLSAPAVRRFNMILDKRDFILEVI